MVSRYGAHTIGLGKHPRQISPTHHEGKSRTWDKDPGNEKVLKPETAFLGDGLCNYLTCELVTGDMSVNSHSCHWLSLHTCVDCQIPSVAGRTPP
jgi:hypothetical protein